jgi:hypothetical protein
VKVDEPGPLSFVLVTVIVVACTGIAVAQSSSTPIADVVARLIASFISLCHCCVENKRGDAIGGGGDESDEALA